MCVAISDISRYCSEVRRGNCIEKLTSRCDEHGTPYRNRINEKVSHPKQYVSQQTSHQRHFQSHDWHFTSVVNISLEIFFLVPVGCLSAIDMECGSEDLVAALVKAPLRSSMFRLLRSVTNHLVSRLRLRINIPCTYISKTVRRLTKLHRFLSGGWIKREGKSR